MKGYHHVTMAAIMAALALACAPTCQAQLPEVAPVDLGELSPDDFADDELDIPYYLHHFHTVANSVVEEGDDRGFIDITVWRRGQDNEPYNARVMENHLSFAWFYCTDRPWNPYYADPAVRAKLEAVLEFWVGMQNDDGRFSEYGVERWNLPATAFATKFMGRTLELLKDGPPIDEDLHQRVIEADRAAIIATLTDENLHSHGTRFANQFSNVWAGALAYVDLFGDEEIRELLETHLLADEDPFMSPAGYFYEANGPDWGYNMGTEQSNVRMAYHYTKDEPLGDAFVKKMALWIDWLSYNAVPEPDSSRWVLNHAIECRTGRTSVFTVGNLAVADRVPLARVWTTTQEQLQERHESQRAALEENWPEVRELREGSFSAFSPYTFLHRDHAIYHPTQAEREEAIAMVPHVAGDRFIHQRVDSRFPLQYTYVRRPGYYVAITTGERVRPSQRYGLNLVWTPELGAVMQSQMSGGPDAWGTRPLEGDLPHEAGSLETEFTIDGVSVEPEAGTRDLPDGTLVMSWPLSDAGQKTVTFADDAIEVDVHYDGGFTEQLPLLLAEEPQIEDGSIVVAGTTLVEIDRTTTEAAAADTRIGDKRLWTVSVDAIDELNYRIIGAQ